MAPGATQLLQRRHRRHLLHRGDPGRGILLPRRSPSHYYDAFSNLIQSTDPGGKVTADTYDQANNLATSTTGAGTTTYGYQPNNWLSPRPSRATGAGFSTPSTSTSFTYYNDGVRHTMADTTGTTTYGYDPYGRLQTVTTAPGPPTYGYDTDCDTTLHLLSQLGRQHLPELRSGATGIVTYGYDNGRPDDLARRLELQATTFGYD